MPRVFNVPAFYRSSGISAVKKFRYATDPRKKDYQPTVLDFGPVVIKIARHFGFCFGVENAIEIAYRAIEENPNKRIFLLSEMIHNPGVNADLAARGVSFLMDTSGNELIDFSSLTPEDIVIVPAFGTTLELQARLQKLGIDPYLYDTTCPFVEKVWKRAADLGAHGYSVIVHGKRSHEETRATFSHSRPNAPTLVILDMAEARLVCDFIRGNISAETLREKLEPGMSEGFDPDTHLTKVGVVNQTTMLATETQEIAEAIRDAFLDKYGPENIRSHFADTRDTLCYATYENQSATLALMDAGADIAVVVGGYNSSNTSHLVELLSQRVPTYYINNADAITDCSIISYFDIHTKQIVRANDWLPKKCPVQISLTSGASCPDRIVDEVMQKIVSFFPQPEAFEGAFTQAFDRFKGNFVAAES